MQVKTYVNEIEVDKLDTGQVATIKLDALPSPLGFRPRSVLVLACTRPAKPPSSTP